MVSSFNMLVQGTRRAYLLQGAIQIIRDTLGGAGSLQCHQMTQGGGGQLKCHVSFFCLFLNKIPQQKPLKCDVF